MFDNFIVGSYKIRNLATREPMGAFEATLVIYHLIIGHTHDFLSLELNCFPFFLLQGFCET